MTFEELQRVNQTIKTIEIKGKNYAQVNERIKAFRMLHPEGFIVTKLISNDGKVCVFNAEVGIYTESGEAHVLGVGTAFEEKDSPSSKVNKTSYIENCETSAVGRALGMIGFGIDTSVASAEEVQNAIMNQGDLITEKEQTILRKTVETMGYKVEDFFKKPLNELTAEEYATACRKLDELKAKSRKK